MNSSVCLLLLLSLLISSTLSRTAVVGVHGRKAQAGKWTPIKNLNDPHVQEIAQFSLADYNKGLGPEGAKWKLLQVPKGDSQVVDVDGKEYRLILKTVSLVYGWGELFQATVLEKKHTMEVIDFTLAPRN